MHNRRGRFITMVNVKTENLIKKIYGITIHREVKRLLQTCAVGVRRRREGGKRAHESREDRGNRPNQVLPHWLARRTGVIFVYFSRKEAKVRGARNAIHVREKERLSSRSSPRTRLALA